VVLDPTVDYLADGEDLVADPKKPRTVRGSSFKGLNERHGALMLSAEAPSPSLEHSATRTAMVRSPAPT
jgi:hypothetical protein